MVSVEYQRGNAESWTVETGDHSEATTVDVCEGAMFVRERGCGVIAVYNMRNVIRALVK